MITRFARGMVYWVDLPNAYGENTQSGRRPCIIVSNNVGNVYSENVTIVPCTTNLEKENTQPTHLKTSVVKGIDSIVLCENITTISKKLTEGFIGLLDEHTMKRIDDCIAIALGLLNTPQNITEDSVTLQAPSQPIEEPQEEPKRISSIELKKQYISDYDKYGVDYIVTKYGVASRSAAYQRCAYYRKQIK